jgi:hypothetical protein
VAATAAPLACNGLYVVRTPGAGEANEIYVSVYDDRAEGDVVPLSDAELGALTERIPWRILRDEAQLQNFLDQATGGREIYVAVIAGLAALLLLESWLSWKVVS